MRSISNRQKYFRQSNQTIAIPSALQTSFFSHSVCKQIELDQKSLVTT